MKKDVDPAFMAEFNTIVVGEIKAYSDGRFFGHLFFDKEVNFFSSTSSLPKIWAIVPVTDNCLFE